MRHGKGFLLALITAAVTTACASGGGAGELNGGADMPGAPDETAETRAAGVHLVQAGLSEGEEAQEAYQEALTDALAAIENSPQNAKGYLVAGQAAIGLADWIRADTMFDRAEELYPGYAEQIVAEREQGWVMAYNMGAEALNAQDLDRAVEMFEAADAIYQGRPEARIALGSVYANRGDMEAAAEAYVGALDIMNQGPPQELDEEQLAEWEESRRLATLNAAELLAQTGDFAQAAEIAQNYLDEAGDDLPPETVRRVRTALAGWHAQAGNTAEAEAIYEEMLGQEDLTAEEYFQAGIGFFNTGDYGRAAESFGSAAELNPYSRDALLNLVQSLYSQAVELEDEEPVDEEQLFSLYQRLVDAGMEVQEMDPLNRNLVSFMLRAYRSLAELSDEATAQEMAQRTQQLFQEYQDQPYGVSEIQLTMQGEEEALISGVLTNLTQPAGETVQLRFELLNAQGQPIDDVVVAVTAPEQNASVRFSETVSVPGGQFAGWRYELVE